MGEGRFLEVPEFSGILSFVDAIFSEINIGLLIYHLEDPTDIATARLIYANKQACRFTGADLCRLEGKLIFEAFPDLHRTSAPRQFAEVVRSGQARKIGVVEYQDRQVRYGKYETRAFPMPHDCFGVIFETSGAEDPTPP